MTPTRVSPATAVHPFRPDFPGEPGYRVKCLDCGRERNTHPYPIPAPRKASA